MPNSELLRSVIEALTGEPVEVSPDTGERDLEEALSLLDKAAEKARAAMELAREKGLDDKAREAEARLRAIEEDKRFLKRRWGIALLEQAARKAEQCTREADCARCLEALELVRFARSRGLLAGGELERVEGFVSDSLYHCLATLIRRRIQEAKSLATRGNYRAALKVLDSIGLARSLLRGLAGAWGEVFQGLLSAADVVRRAILDIPRPLAVREYEDRAAEPPRVPRPPIARTVVLARWPGEAPEGLSRECVPLEVAGVGGTARVYRARCRCCPGRSVAVKVYHEGVDLERAIEEARRWYAATRCPGVVGVYRVPTEADPYMIVEFCERSLAGLEYPPRTVRGVRVIVEAVRDVAEALECAHRHGLAHYDVKPTSILYCSGRWKLSDWGAQPHDYTPGFAAPEQAKPGSHREPGPWTDIFQLGVTAYLMLSGTYPYGPRGERLLDHSYQPAPPIPPLFAPQEGLARTVPAWLRELASHVLQMIDRSPERRPSARAVREAMNRILSQIAPAPGG